MYEETVVTYHLHPVLQLCFQLLLLLSQSLQRLLQLISLLTERRHSAQQLLHLLCGCLTAGFLLREQTVSLCPHTLKLRSQSLQLL